MISIKKWNKKKPQAALIYKITSPTGNIYIGATTKSIESRVSHYKTKDTNSKLLKESIEKYSWSRHTLEIIKELSISESDYYRLTDIEQNYIYKAYMTEPNKILNRIIRGVSKSELKEIEI